MVKTNSFLVPAQRRTSTRARKKLALIYLRGGKGGGKGEGRGRREEGKGEERGGKGEGGGRREGFGTHLATLTGFGTVRQQGANHVHMTTIRRPHEWCPAPLRSTNHKCLSATFWIACQDYWPTVCVTKELCSICYGLPSEAVMSTFRFSFQSLGIKSSTLPARKLNVHARRECPYVHAQILLRVGSGDSIQLRNIQTIKIVRTRSGRLTFAPPSSSCLTTAVCPSLLEAMSGVQPS